MVTGIRLPFDLPEQAAIAEMAFMALSIVSCEAVSAVAAV